LDAKKLKGGYICETLRLEVEYTEVGPRPTHPNPDPDPHTRTRTQTHIPKPCAWRWSTQRWDPSLPITCLILSGKARLTERFDRVLSLPATQVQIPPVTVAED
jgi:hypothetical protein